MIDVRADDAEIRRVLRQLAGALDDLSPAMRQIAGELADITERAFAAEADPATGDPWAYLTAETWERRDLEGHDGPILQVSGHLATSLQSDYGRDYAAHGTNTIYAALHQFGGTPDMPPGPAAVPARPFLGLDPTAAEDILDILRAHLARATRGGA